MGHLQSLDFIINWHTAYNSSGRKGGKGVTQLILDHFMRLLINLFLITLDRFRALKPTSIVLPTIPFPLTPTTNPIAPNCVLK